MSTTLRNWTAVGAVLICLVAPAARTAAPDLPASLDDGMFWRMVSDFSEEGGSFPSDNFVSNETAFQTVIPRLTQTFPPGGVYLGVGPDQNFTYIAALKPRLAFIVDIRRQNMLHHLLYKALFELSPTRAEFLSRLFSRPRPPGLGDDASADAILAAYARSEPDDTRFAANLRDVLDHLQLRHKFTLTDSDRQTIRYVYGAFVRGGPDLTYAGPARTSVGPGTAILSDNGVTFTMRSVFSAFPTYGQLMTETDGNGQHRSYLATEALYRVVRDLELKNLIVPIVGDFAGDKALTSVARYLKTLKGATVTAFYTSNVEQYLFQNRVWQAYYDNVAKLPLDARSTFIRSFFPNQVPWKIAGAPSVTLGGPIASAQLLLPIEELLEAVRRGQVQSYFDLVSMSKN